MPEVARDEGNWELEGLQTAEALEHTGVREALRLLQYAIVLDRWTYPFQWPILST